MYYVSTVERVVGCCCVCRANQKMIGSMNLRLESSERVKLNARVPLEPAVIEGHLFI